MAAKCENCRELGQVIIRKARQIKELKQRLKAQAREVILKDEERQRQLSRYKGQER